MPFVCDYCNMPDPDKCLAGLSCRAWYVEEKALPKPTDLSKEPQPSTEVFDV